MRVWYFSEMAYHPAWEEGLKRGSLRVVLPSANYDPKIGHRRNKQISGRAQSLHADTLALQFGDVADAFPAEQFIATDMDASQQRNRVAGVDRSNVIYCIVQI